MATQADYDRLGAWATVIDEDQQINRRNCKRIVPMEVLSLGASRTGTFSMQEALEILGYPNVYHFSSVIKNVQDADLWDEAFRSKFRGQRPVDYKLLFDQLMGHCGACTDAPAVIFWKELLEAYPDAKVVLVQRDEDKWQSSIMGLVEGVTNPVAVYFLRFADPYWFGRINNTGLWWIKAFFGTTSRSKIQRTALEAYRSHYAQIRRIVPENRLLEFDLKDGWAPLCKFLDKKVAEVPFPHRNEAKALDAAFEVVILKALKHAAVNMAVIVGLVGVLVAVAWRWTT